VGPKTTTRATTPRVRPAPMQNAKKDAGAAIPGAGAASGGKTPAASSDDDLVRLSNIDSGASSSPAPAQTTTPKLPPPEIPKD
jgi:hypothetical protein